MYARVRASYLFFFLEKSPLFIGIPYYFLFSVFTGIYFIFGDKCWLYVLGVC